MMIRLRARCRSATRRQLLLVCLVGAFARSELGVAPRGTGIRGDLKAHSITKKKTEHERMHAIEGGDGHH